jgi:quercetin dioxygenase-like cupin family protein
VKTSLQAVPFVCIGLFGACAADDAAITAKVLAKSATSWDGSPLPPYPAGQAEASIVRIRISPGAQLPIHKHPVINAGVLLSGELTVITEKNEVLHLKAGDPIVEVVDKWHYGRNDGAVPAEIVVFYAGMPGAPLSIHQDAR